MAYSKKEILVYSRQLIQEEVPQLRQKDENLASSGVQSRFI